MNVFNCNTDTKTPGQGVVGLDALISLSASFVLYIFMYLGHGFLFARISKDLRQVHYYCRNTWLMTVSRFYLTIKYSTLSLKYFCISFFAEHFCHDPLAWQHRHMGTFGLGFVGGGGC